MKIISILLVFAGLMLIIDSLFDLSRILGIKIPRKYAIYFAPLGFILIILGIYLNIKGF